MKLFRKLIAVTLGVALTFSMTASAFAKTVDGGGNVVYVDPEVYAVVLPTSENFNFVVDPQGLSAVATGSSLNLDDIAGGTIIGGLPVGAKNNSSHAVKLDVSLTVTGDAVAVTTEAAVEADTNENVLIYMEPTAATVTSLKATDTSLNPDTAFVPSGKGYAIAPSAGTTLTFSLEKAQYQVTNLGNGVYSDPQFIDNTGAGTLLQLGGFVNPNANWAAYAGDSPSKTVGIEAVFTFTPQDDFDPENDTFVAGIPGLKDTGLTALTVEPITPPITPGDDLTKGIVVSGTSTSNFVYTDNYTTLVEANVNQWVESGTMLFYDGGLGIKSVTSQDDGNDTAYPLTSANYGWNATSYNFAMRFASPATKTIIITLEDDSTYQFKIKVS